MPHKDKRNEHAINAGDVPPQLLLVELNEFEPTYLATMADKLSLANLQKVLSYPHSRTWTADQIEHHGLDPWVQWVGVHCGKPTNQHGIRRLGATRVQYSPQIWHAVAREGYTWGVWGPMNAPMGDPAGCSFFMPDPWSFEELAFPCRLNDLLALPRYVAKNYLDIDYRRAFLAALRLARFFAPPHHWSLLARFGREALRAVLSAGANVHTFTTLFDYLSVLCFVKLRRGLRPNFSLIFLNHIAHLQHHFWTIGSNLHPEMRLGLRMTDAMLGLLFEDRQKDEAFLLMNALKQRNVAGRGFYVYRQRNPQDTVETLGLTGGRVEQCMTHEATILFHNATAADKAVELLDGCYLSDGNKAFCVERLHVDRVFYQLAIEHEVAPDVAIVCGGKRQPFYNLFQLVCERTGAHVAEGDVFHDGIDIPADTANHEVLNYVLKRFSTDAIAKGVRAQALSPVN